MPIDLLKKLIQIPSVNPMGKDADPSICHEHRMTKFLADTFSNAGIEHEIVEVTSDRNNVLGWIPGRSDLIVLMDAHQDTVPVENMTINPFLPLEEDGKIFGRGACDVKGGMATMISIAQEFIKTPPTDRPSLLLSCTCDEEHQEQGVFDLVDCLAQKNLSSKIINRLKRLPDVALVFEPTELDVVVAHRGTVRWKIRTKGKAAHSAEPSKGENAIYRMSQIVSLLEEYSENELLSSGSHPLLGKPTLSVGRIEGGTSVNIVPEHCEIEIDRRLLPGDDAKSVMQSVDNYLTQHVDFKFEMEAPWMIAPPLADHADQSWSNQLLESVRQISPEKQIIGVPFGTHAARIAAVGIPAMVFGPGSIQQAHTKDEWISVQDLFDAKQILLNFLARISAKT